MFCLICRHGLPRIVSPPTSVPSSAPLFPLLPPSFPSSAPLFPLLPPSFPLLSPSFLAPAPSFPLLSPSFLAPAPSFPLLSPSFPASAPSFPRRRESSDPYSQGHLPLGKGTATIPCASALVRLPCILRMCISIRNSRDQT